MALTLAEADKYDRTTLLRGVIDEILKVSPLLNALPFSTILGNSLTYNRENAMAGATWYAVGDTWTESTPTVTTITAVLKILGGDADVDNFLKLTRSNTQDLEAEVLLAKAKALAYEFEDAAVYGDDSVNVKQFDGLHAMIAAGAQQVNMGTSTTGAPGTLSSLDALIDLVKPGKPDLLIMSRRTRRGIQKLARAQGSALATTQFGKLGSPVLMYNDVPIAISDFITDTEAIASNRFSAKTGGVTSSVLAVRCGEGALVGLDAGNGITPELVGSLETKDASRWRVKWYCAMALYSTLSIARMDGITSADWTN